MDTERDVTRIVRSWLQTDEHESAERVLETVLGRLDTTRQRRSWWPARRYGPLNTYVKLAMAAAVVVVVAIIGINLLPVGDQRGSGGATISPAPPPSSIPRPSPTASVVFPPAGELSVGQHDMTLEGVSFSFRIPTSGWISHDGFGIDKSTGVTSDGAGFIFWNDTPAGVFSDPCAGKRAPPVGASATPLAAAVAALPGTDLVSGPTDVTVGGHPAKHVVITVRDDVGCPANEFYLWYAPTPDLARYATQLGSTIRVWIVDVDGTLVWIDGETYKGAGPGPGQEVQRIIDSIEFN